MKSRSILATLFVLLLALPASADDFQHLVVFGDSLSDNGNVLALVGEQPTQILTVYWNGRYSNGPVWNDYMAESLGLELINNAHGGAFTGTGAFHQVEGQPAIPGLLEQIAAFDTVPANSLVVINGGANDFFTGSPNIPQMIQNMIQGVATLLQKGATDIIVLGMPDLGITPLFFGQPEQAAGVSYGSMMYNQYLQDAVAQFDASIPEEVDFEVYFFDTATVAADVIADAELYNLTNTFMYCDNAFNPEIDFEAKGHFFWDAVHPTTDVHDILADNLETFIDSIYND